MNTQPKTEEFCIDDLMGELHQYVEKELQTNGKENIEIAPYRYSETETCYIQADRELLRQIFVILLDNAVRYIERGFIAFGYHVLDTNIVDFFVDDTRADYYNEDVSIVRELVEQMGSELKMPPDKKQRSSFRFTVKGITKLIPMQTS